MPRFSGEFTIPRSRPAVYAFLADPERLVKCVPEVIRYEIQDEQHSSVTLRVGIGRVTGPLTMNLEIVEKKEGSYVKIAGKGKMLGSRVSVEGNITLTDLDSHATLVKWEGNVALGAYLTYLVGGVLEKLIKENVEHFTNTVKAEVMRETAA